MAPLRANAKFTNPQREFSLSTTQDTQAVVIGLGYVGLPLAVALAKSVETVGFDVDKGRVAELRNGHDRTNEIDAERLSASTLVLADDSDAIPPSDFYIVTVPTPIDHDRRPDLGILKSASQTVGEKLPAARNAGLAPIVIYESTVYPGVTEEICGPILEDASGLKCGEDFFLAYSPERINPGDREHTVDRIIKVVSGQTVDTLDRVAQLYDRVTTGGTFRAASIKAAEAAKVIENAQRDINIAFMNEIAQIFSKMDISVWDVLRAADTKWNFLPFKPGLVGGHCIGVDPYYLSHRAEKLGHNPKVILSGRAVNDKMADWVAEQVHLAGNEVPGEVIILGLTFKEDVPDLRNSKVAQLIAGLQDRGHLVRVHDPHADPAEARREYGVELAGDALEGRYDTVVLAVPHHYYLERKFEFFEALKKDGGIIADLKGALGEKADWTL